MIGVDSDDPILTDLLTSTLELLAEAGGWVHPDTRIVARGGQFSLYCDTDADGALLVIPRTALLRVDAVTWADDPEHLRFEQLPDDVGDTELALLYIQTALHNRAERLAWIERTHPAVATLPPDVVTQLRTLVPGFRSAPTSARDALFANRCLRVDLGDGHGTQRVLVPVLDLLNHHGDGAVPQWDGESFSIGVRRPFGTSECALDYGLNRDALELAAVYGFADSSAAVAHLPHVSAHVPDIGVVTVRAAGRELSGDFAPLTIDRTDGAAEISHLTFSADPQAMGRLVEEIASTSDWESASSRAVLKALGEQALDRTQELRAMCSADDPALDVLRAAADRQCAVLDSAVDVLEHP